MRDIAHRPRTALITMALLAAAQGSPFRAKGATTGVWNAGSGEWTDAINWTSNPAYPNGVDDVAHFSPPATANVSVALPVTVGGIVFDTYFMQLSSSTGGSITLSSTSGPAKIVATDTLLGSGVTFSLPVNLASDLTVTNDATNGPQPAMVFSGALSGTGNLIVDGVGTVALIGTNSGWTPASIVVQSGVLSTATVTTSGSIFSLGDPTSGTVTVNPGASLDVTGLTLSTASVFTKTLILSGAGNAASPGAVAFGPTNTAFLTNTTLLGTETLEGATTFYGNSVDSVLNIGSSTGAASAAALTGSGTLVKGGTAVMQINIPASFTGGTQVNGGTLTVSTYGTLVGTGQVAVNTGGTLEINKPAGTDPAANSVSPNSIALAGGTLGLAADMSLGNLFAPGPVVGALSIDTPNFTAGGTGVVDLSGLAPGSLLRITLASGGTLTPSLGFVPGATHTVHFGGNFTDNANITDVNGIPTNVEFGGGGTITLNGTSSYTGVTTVNDVTLTLTNAGALGSSVGGTVIDGGALGINMPTAEPFILEGGQFAAFGGASGSTGSLDVTGGLLFLAANWGNTITVSGGNSQITATLTAPMLVSGGQVVFTGRANDPITVNGGTVTIAGGNSGTITLNSFGEVEASRSSRFQTGSVLMNGGYLDVERTGSVPQMINTASTGGIISLNSTGKFESIDFSAFVPGSDFQLGSSALGTVIGALTPDSETHTLHFGGAQNTGTLTVNAVIADVLATPTNVRIDAPAAIILGTANSYTGVTTISGNVLVSDPLGLGDPAVGTVVNGGTLTIAAASAEPVSVMGGVFNVSGNYAGSVTLSAGTVNVHAAVNVPMSMSGGTLNIDASLMLPLFASAGAGKVNSLGLAMGTGGHFTSGLDVTNDAFILEAANPTDKTSKIAFLQSALASGSNGGDWTGMGITSSTLAASYASGDKTRTLAMFDNADLNLNIFGGRYVDADSLLIAPTLIADANLDGSVDTTDFNIWFSHRLTDSFSYAAGDFNTDGVVDGLDFSIWYNVMGSATADPFLEGLGLNAGSLAELRLASVPEPASLAIALLAAPFLLRRRAGRHRARRHT